MLFFKNSNTLDVLETTTLTPSSAVFSTVSTTPLIF